MGVIRSMPKIELHAHFFGSISEQTLQFIREKNGLLEVQLSPSKSDGITTAFRYFSEIYRVVKSSQDVQIAIESVLQDFINDRVIYLELRTSLKILTDADECTYTKIIVNAIEKVVDKIKVKLILSIDRSKLTSETSSRQQLDLVLDISNRFPSHIVGIDIAGDPRQGSLKWILKMLANKHRPSHLKITIHTAEIDGVGEETNEILELRPERIGHGSYLTPEQIERVKEAGIFVELCPTSNLEVMGLKSLEDHHFKDLWQIMKDQVVICTDDIGLFRTSLSEQLEAIQKTFGLGIEDILHLQYNAIKASFASEARQDLQNQLDQFRK